MHRAPTNVNREADHVCVPLHVIGACAANDPAEQNHERNTILFSERIGQPFYGKGREAVHLSVAFCESFLRRAKKFILRFEFRSQPEKIFLAHVVIAFWGSATSSRDSEIAIIGRNRMNKNNSVRNNPMLPKSVAQSQTVGKNIPHDDGTKSRCKLVITITNRSVHMPRSMQSATPRSVTGLRRIHGDHRACGTSTLKNMIAQKIQ